jgi:hypothetical protein
MTEFQNQLCRGDYSYNILANNAKKWYREMLLNRIHTRLESVFDWKKYAVPDLDVKSYNNLYKLSLSQPIYEKYKQKNRSSDIRSKEEMRLNMQLKKQSLETKVKQKPFNMFSNMFGGQKKQYSYAIGQQWLKIDENAHFEQINSSFEVAIKAVNQAKVFHYQRDKKWNAYANWYLNFQLANQNTPVLNHFSLTEHQAIRAYPENKFLDNSGISSRFDLQFPSHAKSSHIAIGWFFDVGSVWNMRKNDAELLKMLWYQKKQQFRRSLAAYQYAEKGQESPQYVQELQQSLWNPAATAKLFAILHEHWQQTWDACQEIFAKPMDMNKLNQLNIHQKAKNKRRCDLQLLVSTGIYLDWHTRATTGRWQLLGRLF